ncbi:helix-turn-helix domain-containing protein [Microbacterium sp. P04]|uniref:helix-turn-helix domain-containing protein n=1 Tax=Microbacterium sp. P04 TaxID=3366947 RepID=UPI0037466EBC
MSPAPSDEAHDRSDFDPEPLWRHLVGEQLRMLRHDRHDSLLDVARRASMSAQYLSEIERGRKEPSSEMLAAVGAALDTTLLELTTAVAERLRGGTEVHAGGVEFRLAA